MKDIKIFFAALCLLAVSAFTVSQSINWKLNENTYSVSFKGKKVEGIIKGLKTTILFDEINPEKSKFSASFDVTTLNTGNGMMNKHAKSEDALDVKKFPTINFESSSVSGKSGVYVALGKLTIKGITKEIKLPFTFEKKGTEALFKGTFSILTKDYGITRKGVPEVLEINCIIPVTR